MSALLFWIIVRYCWVWRAFGLFLVMMFIAFLSLPYVRDSLPRRIYSSY